MNFSNFYQLIAKSPLNHWLETLPLQLKVCQSNFLHSNFKKWINSVKNLPYLIPETIDLLDSVSANTSNITNRQRDAIKQLLRNLMPWRKGPFLLYSVLIDAEWRSDWKWMRVIPHISPLIGRTVLDVGCGNGYQMWRMIGAGARMVVGIDPMQLFFCQFEAIRKLLGNDQRVHLLPLSIDQLPKLQAFNTVFSMGLLYHCRSPIDHLIKLKNQLVSNGELVLETLILKGNDQQVLVPKDRYAKMRNIYFIPSYETLKIWLKKCGFFNIRIVSKSVTSLKEQRRTNWMTHDSLNQFLNPKDLTKTVEGYQAPLRAIIIATKP